MNQNLEHTRYNDNAEYFYETGWRVWYIEGPASYEDDHSFPQL